MQWVNNLGRFVSLRPVPECSDWGKRVIVHTRLESVHLAGNLLGDPSERDVFVYLPPGYDESNARNPTAYLLHAYGRQPCLRAPPLQWLSQVLEHD
jgi:hypothetical protein